MSMLLPLYHHSFINIYKHKNFHLLNREKEMRDNIPSFSYTICFNILRLDLFAFLFGNIYCQYPDFKSWVESMVLSPT